MPAGGAGKMEHMLECLQHIAECCDARSACEECRHSMFRAHCAHLVPKSTNTSVLSSVAQRTSAFSRYAGRICSSLSSRPVGQRSMMSPFTHWGAEAPTLRQRALRHCSSMSPALWHFTTSGGKRSAKTIGAMPLQAPPNRCSPFLGKPLTTKFHASGRHNLC